MAKFMILYNSELSASELMASATPEQMQASMQEWINWRDLASKTFKIEFGLPLQASSKITPRCVENSASNISGYSIAEGNSKADLDSLLVDHPHLKRSGAWIDVLEMLSMPGIDS